MNTAFKQKPITVRWTEGERRVFKIPEKISTADWAERYRMVVDGGRKSQWRNDLSPCAVGVMDALDSPFIREVYVQAAPQTIKTQPFINYLMKRADQVPSSAMVVMPDEKLVRRFFRRRLIKSLRETPRTAALLSPIIGDITRTSVAFINGMDITGAWAGSSAAMASDAMEIVIMDEMNKYPPPQGDEPNAFDAAEQRANSYPFTYKIYGSSTPSNDQGLITVTIKKRADVIYRYYVKCPICGEEQRMVWDNISWGDVRDSRRVLRENLARYNCRACAFQWDDDARNRAVLAAKDMGWKPDIQWQCTKCSWTGYEQELTKDKTCPICQAQAKDIPPLARPRAVAFMLPSWYVRPMSKAVAAFLDGQDDREKLKTWVTQHCAEEWVEKYVKKSESVVLKRQSIYPALIVPPDVVALTLSIDTQKRGFWFLVRGWDENLTSWLIQYGYTTTWADIENLIYHTQYKIYNSNETMGIWRAGIDIGGGESESGEWSRTEEVEQWLRKQPIGSAQKVYGIKGMSHTSKQKRIDVSKLDHYSNSKKPIPGGLEIRLLDTSQYKHIIHSCLERAETTIDGLEEKQLFYVHKDVGMDYVKQLLSEEWQKGKSGKWVWKQKYYQNHLLDCEVIARALADPQWIPSLQMLAVYLKTLKNQQAPKPDNVKKAPKNKTSRW